ncbi:hypothetical protein [Flavobacterium sp.]|jgi:hypothetical protein|uniref:hypothetical protein n=1 Tax=Flavobacterium sp. TaxID=239 RepID=UPI0037BE8518
MGTEAITGANASSFKVTVNTTNIVVDLIFNEDRPKYTFSKYSITSDGGILITFTPSTTSTVLAGTLQSFTVNLASGTRGSYTELVLGDGKPNPRVAVRIIIPV